MSSTLKDTGLDAGKDPFPIGGMEYTATDTKKFYRCYADGVWTWEQSGGGAGPRQSSLANVGNVGTGEDDLISLTLPANTLNAAGTGVKITAWGVTAANVNSKILRIRFGGQVVFAYAMPTSVSVAWRVEVLVFRTGSNTQESIAHMVGIHGVVSINDVESQSSLTVVDTSAIIVKGTGDATADNDIQQEGMLMEPFA